MNSSDLGPAMALSGARDGALRDALERVARAADQTATATREAAESLADPHDRTAGVNISLSWSAFAQNLRAQGSR